MMKKTTLFGLGMALLLISASLHAQDSTREATLKEIRIQSWRPAFKPVAELPEVHNTYLLSGKKSEVISLDETPANISEKTVRQVFAKIPGAFAYDMDGSGNQVNLALRGLDPHRSWDLNVRQDGVMLNSDIFGYPASHYSPPMEAIERIEIVRGTASLQYGAMFGGMVNYVTKLPDTTRAFSYEGQHTAGSFGLLSGYNAIGGRKGRITWSAYDARRTSQGYRANSRSDYQAQYASIAWQILPRLSVKAAVGRSTYLYQIPGPLNDSMMAADPRQSTRLRNFYSPDIIVPSLTLDWALSDRTQIQWITSHLRGARNSVQFIGASDRRDVPQADGSYRNRQVDIDRFNSNTSELRLLHRYRLLGLQQVLATGVRFIHNDLNRRQIGRGTAGFDYDLSLVDPNWGRDLHYRTRNVAFFAENLIYLTPALSISPGIRVENGRTTMDGVMRVAPTSGFQTEIDHRFALLGVQAQYKPAAHWRVFAGWSQAYRPVIMGEVIPANDLERIDPNLRSSDGYNAELGLQGDFWNKRLKISATLFQIQYNNRIGNQATEDENGQTYFLKTNVGDSRTTGLEWYSEAVLVSNRTTSVTVFSATAYMDGRYTSGRLTFQGEQVALAGKKVESVPLWTSRNGLQVAWKRWSAALQYSYVSETFSDPANTLTPTPNGSRGLVPAYSLWDAHLGCQASARIRFRLSVSNLANTTYFTKRPTIYPGPGVWPSDGRGMVVAMVLNL